MTWQPKKSKCRGDRAKVYDSKVHSSVLSSGDHILVRNLSWRFGPGKLAAYWEQHVHKVICQKGANSPVYDVQKETGDGPVWTLHSNLLFPCTDLPIATTPSTPKQPKPGQVRVYRPKKQRQNRAQSHEDESPNSSDEEDINCVITTPPKPSHSLDKSQFEASGESLRNTPFAQETTTETSAKFGNPSLAMTVTPDVPENIAPSSTASQFHSTALAQTPAPKPDEHTQMLPGELPQTNVTKLKTSIEGSESETVGRLQRN